LAFEEKVEMTDPKYYDRPQPGWQLLAPGMYVDEDESMHLFPGEILNAYGWPDTPENRAVLYEVLPEIIRKKFGQDISAWITSKNGAVKL
jgi:hypothetical protein